MKAAAYALLLLVVLALAVPGLAQAPGDKLIVPGQRIGKWTLDMTIDDLVRMHGPKNSVGTYGLRPVINAHDWSPTGRAELWFHVWGAQGLIAGTFGLNSQRVVLLATDNYVKTAQGIGTGIPERAVQGAYGKPTATVASPRMGGSYLVYDKMGVYFRALGGGTVQGVGIFRPGTAKRIWVY